MLNAMLEILVRLQYYLFHVLIVLVPAIALLCFGLGTMYWVDVWGRPNALKEATLHLDEVGDVKIFYPRSTQLNTLEAKHIELEFVMLQPPSQMDTLVVTFEESIDHIKLAPEAVELSLASLPVSAPTINVETRDLNRPPASVDIVVTATEPKSGMAEQATIRLTIDNTLWRIAAAFAIVSGAVTFLGAARTLLKKR